MREPDVIDYIKELSVLTIAKKLTEITGFKNISRPDLLKTPGNNAYNI